MTTEYTNFACVFCCEHVPQTEPHFCEKMGTRIVEFIENYNRTGSLRIAMLGRLTEARVREIAREEGRREACDAVAESEGWMRTFACEEIAAASHDADLDDRLARDRCVRTQARDAALEEAAAFCESLSLRDISPHARITEANIARRIRERDMRHPVPACPQCGATSGDDPKCSSLHHPGRLEGLKSQPAPTFHGVPFEHKQPVEGALYPDKPTPAPHVHCFDRLGGSAHKCVNCCECGVELTAAYDDGGDAMRQYAMDYAKRPHGLEMPPDMPIQPTAAPQENDTMMWQDDRWYPGAAFRLKEREITALEQERDALKERLEHEIKQFQDADRGRAEVIAKLTVSETERIKVEYAYRGSAEYASALAEQLQESEAVHKTIIPNLAKAAQDEVGLALVKAQLTEAVLARDALAEKLKAAVVAMDEIEHGITDHPQSDISRLYACVVTALKRIGRLSAQPKEGK